MNDPGAAAAEPIGSADHGDAEGTAHRHLVDLLTAAFAIGGYACCIDLARRRLLERAMAVPGWRRRGLLRAGG